MKKIVTINSEFCGQGSDELGKKLMGSFFRKLWVEENKPEAIIFYNSGVKLLAEGSSVLDALNGLFNSGIDLIACGTCVGYYQLKNKITVGRISDMREIVSLLMNSDNTITV